MRHLLLRLMILLALFLVTIIPPAAFCADTPPDVTITSNADEAAEQEDQGEADKKDMQNEAKAEQTQKAD